MKKMTLLQIEFYETSYYDKEGQGKENYEICVRPHQRNHGSIAGSQ